MRRWMVLWMLVGCGPNLDAFLPEYVDSVCELVLECTDPAVRTFDGTNSMDACWSVWGPSIAEPFASCDYRPALGKACLDAIDEVRCPEYVLTVDAVLPEACVTLTEECGADDGWDTAE